MMRHPGSRPRLGGRHCAAPGRLGRFSRDRAGNIAIVFALACFPMVAIMGMGLDYTLASRREAQLNAAADSAALMTTSPPGMAMTAAAAQSAAVAMFQAQAAAVGGAAASPPSITVSDTSTASGVLVMRNTTVSYSATSKNAFSTLLKMNTMSIGGISKVSSSTAPNIDFYMLLDTSPSMGIPATQSGIDTMVSHTKKQGGCAFACHETSPTAGDVAGNPPGMDNYALAQSLNLTLRIDLVRQATANLISTAAATSAVNKAAYRVAIYTADQSFQTVTNLTSDLKQAQSDANSKIQMLQVYSNSMLTSNNNNNDQDTQLDGAMSYTAYIPNPGKGTNLSGDTPKEILFIVTDGVIDEAYPNVGPSDNTYGGRTITTLGHQYDYCTPLKNRNVRIAVLYTTYNPLPTNAFYNSYVAPFQPQIPTALQSCASPGLFFQVDTGGDIVGAMQTLFVKAVQSVHLTQ